MDSSLKEIKYKNTIWEDWNMKYNSNMMFFLCYK